MSRMKEDEDSWTYLIAGCLTGRGLTISSAKRFAIEEDFFWISLGATVARGQGKLRLEDLYYSKSRKSFIYKPIWEGEETHSLGTRSNFQSALENSSDIGRYFLGAIEIFSAKRDTGVQSNFPVNYLVNRKPQDMIWPNWIRTNCGQFWNKILFYPKIEGACVNTRFW